MLQLLLRLSLFLLSSLGWWEYLRTRHKIPLYFLPAMTIALQFLVLFFAGLWNLLPYAAWGLYLLGFLLLLHSLRRDKLGVFKCYVNPGYLLLVLLLAVVVLAVRGQVIHHYDDYTHWTRIVKMLVERQRFPNFSDGDIGFQSYPLGSSGWIYFFSLFVGNGESVWMLAQGYMTLAMLLPLWSWMPKRSWLGLPLMALLFNGLLCYNIPLTSLLVDTLLPLAGMAALAFLVWEYWGQDAPWDCRLCWAAPLLCLTGQIKNSGILFVVLGIALLLLLALRYPRHRREALLTALLPLAVLLLWNRHCDYMFPSALEGFHALSTENFANTIAQKSLEDIRFIAESALNFLFTRRELFWLLAVMAVLSAALLAAGEKKAIRRYLSCAVSLYLLYSLGITLMYLFSMSLSEARNLACIDRYMRTIDVCVYYLTAGYAMHLLSQVQTGKRAALLFATLLVLATLGWHQYYGRFATVFEASGGDRRRQLEALVEENGIPTGESYFLCIPGDDSRYTWFVGTYLLESGMVEVQVIDDAAKLDAAADYNFFLNLDPENQLIQSWIDAHHPHHAGEAAFPTFS